MKEEDEKLQDQKKLLEDEQKQKLKLQEDEKQKEHDKKLKD